MASLYIANCSRQAHEFLYRMPGENMAEQRKVRAVRIEAGTQQMIIPDAPLAVLEAVVDQHRQYGLMPAEDITNAKTFVGLCFSFDKPVNFDRLNYAFDHNAGVLFDQGERQREAAAITIAQAMEEHIGEPMRAVETAVLEEGDNPKLGKGIRVTRDETLAREGGRRNGRGLA